MECHLWHTVGSKPGRAKQKHTSTAPQFVMHCKLIIYLPDGYLKACVETYPV